MPPFIDNLLVRIHFIIGLIWWTGLAPWEFEFPFPGSLISTVLVAPLTCQGSRVHVLSEHSPTPFRYLAHGVYTQDSNSKSHISQTKS